MIPWQVYAGGAAIALACLFWWWLTRNLKKQGATELRADTAEKGVADARKANEARAGVDHLPDGGALDELRKRYQRD